MADRPRGRSLPIVAPDHWGPGWRDRLWAAIDRRWDLIVVGGGITGAGVLRSAARTGVRALLVEQRDFAWGTSSRSSKLVHGGLRYLVQGQLRLTRHAVAERERLLGDAPGLVTPMGFLVPLYEGDRVKQIGYRGVLRLYDALACRWAGHRLDSHDFCLLSPLVHPDRLVGGLRYRDAQTDDARLVLRVLREAVAGGAVALNYATVTSLLRQGVEVCGVRVRDEVTGREVEIRATVVVNATGVWADRLRHDVGASPRMRPLRGSHLVFPAWRFPLATGVNWAHPGDGRKMFAVPWESVTVVGTTDLDHTDDLDSEVSISAGEVDYLLEATADPFRSLQLTAADVVSTWSGVRPVVSSGAADPSSELRDHVVWDERGLVTVTGGKLTTFRLAANDALRAAAHRLPALGALHRGAPALDPLPPPPDTPVGDAPSTRFRGRYGREAAALLGTCAPEELEPIPGTLMTWAELRWAARCEGVVHLDDLLLRRVRLGLLLPRGGAEVMPAVRAICQAELSWDDARWEREQAAYAVLVTGSYGVPGGEPVSSRGTRTVTALGTTSAVTGSGPTGSPSA